ncbi:uncharacterized protein LOC126687655 [Mercurialis annua]|uniref:uncharacterized protein LOC126687655 n=1 Tax=Mercurialis annua TaxID=3986 RepID=UPI00215F8152|nr:uncharacterized protein LOC126687655 [Mercurialis annua]
MLKFRKAGRGQASRGRGRGCGVAAGIQAPGIVALQTSLVQLEAGQAAMQDQYVVLGQIVQQQVPQAGGAAASGVGISNRELVLAYKRMKPTEFDGSGDALDFLEEVEQNACRLQGSAGDWFRRVIHPEIDAITWDSFVMRFRDFYLPLPVIEGHKDKLVDLKRGDRLVQESTTEFVRLSRFAPELQTEQLRVNDRYMKGLGPEFVTLLTETRRDFTDLVDSARCMESTLLHFGKMPEAKKVGNLVHSSGQQDGSSNSHSKSSQFKSNDRRGYQPHSHSASHSGSNRSSRNGNSGVSSVPFCQTCRRGHFGVCLVAPGSCYACGQPGHFPRQCPASGQQVSSASMAHPSFQQ